MHLQYNGGCFCGCWKDSQSSPVVDVKSAKKTGSISPFHQIGHSKEMLFALLQALALENRLALSVGSLVQVDRPIQKGVTRGHRSKCALCRVKTRATLYPNRLLEKTAVLQKKKKNLLEIHNTGAIETSFKQDRKSVV